MIIAGVATSFTILLFELILYNMKKKFNTITIEDDNVDKAESKGAPIIYIEKKVKDIVKTMDNKK